MHLLEKRILIRESAADGGSAALLPAGRGRRGGGQLYAAAARPGRHHERRRAGPDIRALAAKHALLNHQQTGNSFIPDSVPVYLEPY